MTIPRGMRVANEKCTDFLIVTLLMDVIVSCTDGACYLHIRAPIGLCVYTCARKSFKTVTGVPETRVK